MSFYVQLPCTAKNRGERASSRYTTNLARNIVLPTDEQWLVALSSMCYQGQTFGYLSEDERTIELLFKGLLPKDFITNYKDMNGLRIGIETIDIVLGSFSVDVNNYDLFALMNAFCNAINAETLHTKVTANYVHPHLIFNVENTIIEDVIIIRISEDLNALLFSEEKKEVLLAIEKPNTTLYLKTKQNIKTIYTALKDYITVDENLVGMQLFDGKTRHVQFAKMIWPLPMFVEHLKDGLNADIIISTKETFYDKNICKQRAILTIKSKPMSLICHLNREFCDLLNISITNFVIPPNQDYNLPIAWAVELHSNQIETYEVDEKYFSSIEALCSSFTKSSLKVYNNIDISNAIKFEYNDSKVTVTISKDLEIKLDGEFTKKLGLQTWADKWIVEGTYTGETISISPIRRIHSFSVLCNIINDQFVGNKMYPLLRYVPNSAAPGEWHTENLTEHYLPLKYHVIPCIELCVCRNDTTEPIPFENDFSCTLHFQRA